ncbi:DUF5131 family protein [Azotobacter beijerinckii]|uniref:DUF5131 family protein n=1 Tax=Azotobacter beijerinckii TaxID=170623 RepID=UPI0029545AA9|nr:phage Gp37/Gp68 family protein [Azotobacter beijerinckii]MDV7211841.1 phage Gp37/Gp68 family protein [Azotobacter beijerinckii]
MSDKTGIEWTDATWNPIRGCSRVSDGCRHCYAEAQAARIISMDRGRGIPEGQGSYDGLLAKGGQWNGQIKVVESAMEQPQRWRKPRRIFVNSMSDLFHENVPEEVIQRIFAVMASAPHHTFQILTKRAERMREVLSSKDARWIAEGQLALTREGILKPGAYHVTWPLPNVWLGVTVENQAAADERIPQLLETPAAVRWLSIEPLLGPVHIENYLCECPEDDDGAPYPGRIDWVVVGGESGPNARPMHPHWATSLRDQCLAAGVPFLFKQWGEWRPPVTGESFSTAMGRAQRVPAFIVAQDGTVHCFKNEATASGGEVLLRVGKHAAGRRLQGELHDAYPTGEAVACRPAAVGLGMAQQGK